jgi:hypothetical protein
MNKLDVIPPDLTISSASFPSPEPVRRLIVLVPTLEADLTLVTRRVWELANATDAYIQFLGLYSDPVQEPHLRRELVTMSVMVNDGRVTAEADVMFGKDWVDVVKTRVQAGDMVVCFAEQCVGLSRRPLSQILQSKLNVPLYILSDLYPQNDSRSNWPSQIAAWAGSIAIILGLFVFQAKIDHHAKDWTHTLLLLFSIPFEIWLIWVWNSLFE